MIFFRNVNIDFLNPLNTSPIGLIIKGVIINNIGVKKVP